VTRRRTLKENPEPGKYRNHFFFSEVFCHRLTPAQVCGALAG